MKRCLSLLDLFLFLYFTPNPVHSCSPWLTDAWVVQIQGFSIQHKVLKWWFRALPLTELWLPLTLYSVTSHKNESASFGLPRSLPPNKLEFQIYLLFLLYECESSPTTLHPLAFTANLTPYYISHGALSHYHPIELPDLAHSGFMSPN